MSKEAYMDRVDLYEREAWEAKRKPPFFVDDQVTKYDLDEGEINAEEEQGYLD